MEVPETPQLRPGHTPWAANGLWASKGEQETLQRFNVKSPAEDDEGFHRIMETPQTGDDEDFHRITESP